MARWILIAPASSSRSSASGSNRGSPTSVRRRHPRQDESVEDGSQDLYQQEFDAGRARDLRDQLAAVERAEARLDDGTYGRSVDSGEPIPDARLEALPTAELTVEEQDRAGRP